MEAIRKVNFYSKIKKDFLQSSQFYTLVIYTPRKSGVAKIPQLSST